MLKVTQYDKVVSQLYLSYMTHWLTVSQKFALGGGSVCMSLLYKRWRSVEAEVSMLSTFSALFMVCVALSTNENWLVRFVSPSSDLSEAFESRLLESSIFFPFFFPFLLSKSSSSSASSSSSSSSPLRLENVN